jgi:hypothetical protein
MSLDQYRAGESEHGGVIREDPDHVGAALDFFVEPLQVGVGPGRGATVSGGPFPGTTRISGRGRPALRLAARRATWGALAHNPVLQARHAHLTGRDHHQLNDAQARTALAAALLRWLWVVVTKRVAWQAAIAAGTLDPRAAKEVTAPAA